MIESEKEKLQVLIERNKQTFEDHAVEIRRITGESNALAEELSRSEQKLEASRENANESRAFLQSQLRDASLRESEAQMGAVSSIQRQLQAHSFELARLRKERSDLQARRSRMLAMGAGAESASSSPRARKPMSLMKRLRQKEREVHKLRDRVSAAREAYEDLLQEAGGREVAEAAGLLPPWVEPAVRAPSRGGSMSPLQATRSDLGWPTTSFPTVTTMDEVISWPSGALSNVPSAQPPRVSTPLSNGTGGTPGSPSQSSKGPLGKSAQTDAVTAAAVAAAVAAEGRPSLSASGGKTSAAAAAVAAAAATAANAAAAAAAMAPRRESPLGSRGVLSAKGSGRSTVSQRRSRSLTDKSLSFKLRRNPYGATRSGEDGTAEAPSVETDGPHRAAAAAAAAAFGGSSAEPETWAWEALLASEGASSTRGVRGQVLPASSQGGDPGSDPLHRVMRIGSGIAWTDIEAHAGDGLSTPNGPPPIAGGNVGLHSADRTPSPARSPMRIPGSAVIVQKHTMQRSVEAEDAGGGALPASPERHTGFSPCSQPTRPPSPGSGGRLSRDGVESRVYSGVHYSAGGVPPPPVTSNKSYSRGSSPGLAHSAREIASARSLSPTFSAGLLPSLPPHPSVGKSTTTIHHGQPLAIPPVQSPYVSPIHSPVMSRRPSFNEGVGASVPYTAAVVQPTSPSTRPRYVVPDGRMAWSALPPSPATSTRSGLPPQGALSPPTRSSAAAQIGSPRMLGSWAGLPAPVASMPTTRHSVLPAPVAVIPPMSPTVPLRTSQTLRHPSPAPGGVTPLLSSQSRAGSPPNSQPPSPSVSTRPTTPPTQQHLPQQHSDRPQAVWNAPSAGTMSPPTSHWPPLTAAPGWIASPPVSVSVNPPLSFAGLGVSPPTQQPAEHCGRAVYLTLPQASAVGGPIATSFAGVHH
eukprot:gnl/TRDRNA2_/TRDRNA2_124513_c1_seq1.p1 gnl/TRDRNA2_/TRDRNA2_124513_c1~~gnl/TRDRNA2_/TRDRNA2_124513_c1_seq1.p1  ORF type:complete len:920 (-),score=113.54 gnl/TRDRNA2_/TRDRNA2_124513_c1_seq1:167-2926(-)